jgi:DNA polymerase-3 subunit delta'
VSWQGIEGHDEIRRYFEQAIGNGRLAHAYLFSGPPGIGKRRFALALAKTLLCRVVPASQMAPCGECLDCREVEAGIHPDLILAHRPEESVEFPIDVVRDVVIRGLSLKPDRGSYKVAILDDADDFNVYAANALLKTLEEPPVCSLLILISTSPHHLPPTLVSRCHLIWFQPLPEEILARVLLQQGAATDLDEARSYARLAEGSVALAQAFADPKLRQCRDRLWHALAQAAAGLPELWDLATEIGESGSAADRRQRVRSLLRLALAFLRAAAQVAAGAPPPAGLKEPQRLMVERIAKTVPLEQLLRMIDRTLLADYHNERRVQQTLLLEAWATAVTDLAAEATVASAQPPERRRL